MTTPTPGPATLVAGPPAGPGVEFDARVLLADEHGFALRPDDPPLPLSWTVTFGFGKPAAGTYTEVRFDPGAVDPLRTHLDDHAIERVLDEVVRFVAVATYGTAWAFHYRPEQFYGSVHGGGKWPAPRRREVLYVDRIEVYP